MLFGGRKMKHKKQKKTKKAGRILLAVFAVLIGTLGVLLCLRPSAGCGKHGRI